LVTIALAVIGGVISLVSVLVESGKVSLTSTAISVLGMAVAILIDLLALETLQNYFSGLHSRWTDLRTDCHNVRRAINLEGDRIPERQRTEIGDLERTKAAIDKSERIVFGLEWYHRRCQKQVNRQTYAVSEGTYEEVMRRLGHAT
jgi:hypothetical protein